MKLRWYQEEAIDSLFHYLSTEKGNPLIALPTGTGKSLVIAAFIRNVMRHYRDQRFLMLTHVKELIVQNMAELLEHWPTAPAGVYSAGIGRKEHQYPITFAGIASIHKKAALFGHIDIVFVDEAHLVSHAGTTMYRTFLEALRKVNPRIRVVGLTATHYRLGLGMLTDGGLFSDVCYDLTTMQSFSRLVAEGFLAPLISKRTNMQYDLSRVRTTGGDYNQGELQTAVDIDDLTYAAVQETVAHMQDRKACLVFASGIGHSEHVCTAIRRIEGNRAATFVHSKMAAEERDSRIAAFKAGEYRYMVNNSILTTGFNFPALDTEAIMMATKSTGKWVQILGRLTRPAPGKANGLVLDFGGNTERLGPINDPVIPGKKGKGGGIAPVRLCPACMTYNHASVTSCCQCGHEFPRMLKIKQSASTKEVMKDDTPVVEDFKVDRIIYSNHERVGGVPSLLVSYYSGLRMFREWVCLEHTSAIRFKALKWWIERYPDKAVIPGTIVEALSLVGKLKEPKTIKVWTNAKYPEIINYGF